MPTYLIHGFRWHRANIRIYIILNNVEEAASEWLMAPNTSNALLNSFYTQFDFLPPSTPGPIELSSPEPSPIDPLPAPAKSSPRTLTKRDKRSMLSLKSSRSLGKTPSNGPNTSSNSGPETSHSRPASGVGNSNGKAPQKKEPEKSLRFNQWSVVKLVEQYDPDDMFTKSQPWAYVSDYMVEVGLGVSIAEEIDKYKKWLAEKELVPPCGVNESELKMSPREIRKRNQRAGWFDKLKENLEKGEEMGWYVVVCGDEERWVPPEEESDEEKSAEDEIEDPPPKTPVSARIKGFFSKRRTESDSSTMDTNSVGPRGQSRGDDSTHESVRNNNV